MPGSGMLILQASYSCFIGGIMTVKTNTIPSFQLKVLDETRPYCWLSDLQRIIENYPFLKNPHQLQAYTLLFIQDGSGSLQVDQHTIMLTPASVICIQPDNVISFCIENNIKARMLCFTESFFSLRYNNNVLYQFEWLRFSTEKATALSKEQFIKCSTILQFMNDEFQQNYNHGEKVIRSYLNILLFELDKNFKRDVPPVKPGSSEEKIIHFEKLIELNYQQHKNPSWYANQLHISVNYLNKLCQTLRNNTSSEIIRKRVLIEAKRMLYYTSLSVAEIAYELGFDSSSYFITFFKKHSGVTPEMFRKQ
jgi:AraC family transcriptional activator of pobA